MSYYVGDVFVNDQTDYISHHGILGQKWGVRRYQNKDGSLTNAGRERYEKFDKAVNDQRNLLNYEENGVDAKTARSMSRKKFDQLSDEKKAYYEKQAGTKDKEAVYNYFFDSDEFFVDRDYMYDDKVKKDYEDLVKKANASMSEVRKLVKHNRKQFERDIGQFGAAAIGNKDGSYLRSLSDKWEKDLGFNYSKEKYSKGKK